MAPGPWWSEPTHGAPPGGAGARGLRSRKPLEDAPQARTQRRARLPAQLGAGASDVQATAPHLAWALGREHWRRERPAVRDVVERVDEVEHGRLVTVADVDRTGEPRAGDEHVGRYDVGDVDPVAGLAAVAEHGRCAP